jgi:hypothetical protein
MNTELLVAGIVLLAGAALVWVLTYLDPLAARQKHRLVRRLNWQAGQAGLRGRYDFTQRSPSGGPGIYEPADEQDRALFAAVRSTIESESAFFATQTLWSDERLDWGGIALALVGAILCATSFLV